MSAVAARVRRWKDGLTASSDRMMWQLQADHGQKQVTSGKTYRGSLTHSPVQKQTLTLLMPRVRIWRNEAARREEMQAPADSRASPLRIGGITPFFIVEDITKSRAFYTEKLGFAVTYEQADFAVIRRDEAQVMIKMIGPGTPPFPNAVRHPWAKWDAYVPVSDPDAFWIELSAAGFPDESAVSNTTDGQRGCTVKDPDGYVLFFGRTAGVPNVL